MTPTQIKRRLEKEVNRMTTLTDDQMRECGRTLAVALKLRRDREHKDRWQTEWGTKTDLGLFLTLVAVVEKAQRGKKL